MSAEQRKKLKPGVSSPSESELGHGESCLRVTWSFLVPEGFSHDEIEVELQYGYRRKGSWKNSHCKIRPGSTSFDIEGLEPKTGYVARVRARYRADGDEKAGGWSDWAKSMPMATMSSSIGGEDPLRPSSAAKMQELFELLVEVTEDTETPAEQSSLSALAACLGNHPDLCSEATDFLMEAVASNASPHASGLLPEFSPAVHKALVTLLALCTQASYVAHASADEPLLARLWQLTEYTCVEHPAHGTMPQEMVRKGAQKLTEKLDKGGRGNRR